jgi:hypothetical protein
MTLADNIVSHLDDETKSSSSEAIRWPPFLNATYRSGDKPNGTYVKDNFTIGTAHIKDLEFGKVEEGNFTAGGGMMGLGFDTAEFGPNKTYQYLYPSLLDALYNESIIDSRSFGIYLNNFSKW